MRIMLIGRQLKYGGGMEKFLSLLANGLYKNYSLDVCVLLLGKRFENEYVLSDKINIIALDELRESKGIIDSIVHNFCIFKKLSNAVKQFVPDVVLSFLPDLATICKLRFPKIKVIGSLRVNPKVDILGLKNKLLGIELTRILDGFIFLTKETVKYYPAHTLYKSTVIPLGVEEKAIVDINRLRTRKKIYASGRLVKGKHFDEIIKAFSKVYSLYSDFELIILGSGEERDNLESLIKTLSLENAVQLLGLDKDPCETMLDGYMYVFASSSEGYSNALAESMMIGLPCIATNCDFGPSDMITDHKNGILVEVGNVDDLASAMIELIKSPDLAELFSNNNWKFRISHNLNRIINNYYSYICNVYDGMYNLKLQDRILNHISKTEFTIAWRKINNETDVMLSSDNSNLFNCLKLNGKEWYADPIVYEYDEKTYVFMELFDNETKKGKIAVSILSESGLSTPNVIIEESWHLSYPRVFEFDGNIYILPETNKTKNLYFYKCINFPNEWKLTSKIENIGRFSDSEVLSYGKKLIIIFSEKKADNPFFTRLKIGELKNIDGKFIIDMESFERFNLNQDYSLNSRNGGSIFVHNGDLVRVCQESSPLSYGLGLRFNKILNINKNEFKEETIKRICVNDIKSNLQKNCIATGIHTYGKSKNYEVVDLKVYRL